jgi:prepilin-type N-terminal cleavage/methylation domain-containing protein
MKKRLLTTKQNARKKAFRLSAPATGFSLIELLVVVAIILIISAIAIPNLIRSRIAANESAAVASCRNIVTAEVVYSSTYGIGYSNTLLQLGPAVGGAPGPNGADLIDSVLASGSKHGYSFTYTPVDANSDGFVEAFMLHAEPLNPGFTGDRYFFTDQTGVIRADRSGPADVNDPPIG